MNKLGIQFLEEAEQTVRGEEKFCAWAQMAREGTTLYLREENISCPLARYNLGYDEYTSELARTLVRWGDVANEKAAERFLKESHRLNAPGVILLSTELKTPHIIVHFGTPGEIKDEIGKFSYTKGEWIRGYVSGIGAMCGELTAVPWATRAPNVSAGCGGSRKRVFKKYEAAIAFPTSLDS